MTGRSPAPARYSGQHRARAPGHADLVLGLFDAKAHDWSAKYVPAGRLAGRLRLFPAAVRASVRAGGDLLDLGCGSGELARQLAADGYRVVGADIAPRMLDQAAAANVGATVTWVRLDPRWRALPFAAASVDAVIASSVLEYVPEPAAALRECARVLRPGGVLLCTVPDVAHAVRRLEGPLAWVARKPLGGVSAVGWPRLAGYLTYLRISRNRQTARWWDAAAQQAGLAPAPGPAPGQPRTPLRLLAFSRPGATARSGFDTSRGHL